MDHADRSASVQSMHATAAARYLPDTLNQPFALDHAQMLQVRPSGAVRRFGRCLGYGSAVWVVLCAVTYHGIFLEGA